MGYEMADEKNSPGLLFTVGGGGISGGIAGQKANRSLYAGLDQNPISILKRRKIR